MRAIVIKQYGGPEVLQIEERPDPQPKPGHIVIDVKAFGLNHAEIYFRKGLWGDVAEITGIECVGTVRSDADGRFTPGQTVMALVGGLGRSINGSYAEQVCVPVTNVVAVEPDRRHSRRDLRARPSGGEYRKAHRRPRHRHDAQFFPGSDARCIGRE